ncbi:F0F1 ATP synthase subunit delta [Selenihalanaerobacter shriftii]|uniref:ATP synthase subunit delta n=1 Tax=Selenihalanaerobacter shriftii TaxID=142842 RepID=A0A1T4L008_9FIRM|nr:F0F1 ATP synthase subunit delta [Selenihalanaerobacter shriftii]SJZ48062.1 F-type H+-transporting ATPase subunit delta [Selenihalanaerobacter shriftii]
MINNQIAKRYSQALFELAVEKSKVKELQDDLIEVLDTIEEHEELNEVIYHPRISREDKKSLLDELFGSKISQTLLNFLKLLIDKRREKTLEAILDQYIELANQENKILEIEVETAVELSDDNSVKLKEKLEELTNTEVILDIKINPELIGGLVLKIGDKVIDGSLHKYLQVMKDNLTKIEVSQLGVN